MELARKKQGESWFTLDGTVTKGKFKFTETLYPDLVIIEDTNIPENNGFFSAFRFAVFRVSNDYELDITSPLGFSNRKQILADKLHMLTEYTSLN